MKITVTGTRGIPDILGGVETHCQELYPLLVQRGFDIGVIRRTEYCKDKDISSYQGVKLYNIDSPKSKSFEAIIHTFKAVYSSKFKHKANIVHIHAIGPAILTPFARLLGLKVVFTHHGADYDRDKWGFLAKTMLRIGEGLGAVFANEVIVISNVINQSLKEKYNRQNCRLIYNGVPKPEILPSAAYLQSLNLESKKYLFAMGRFVPEKNFDHIIEAFAPLSNMGYKLVFAGDNTIEDEYSIQLKQMAISNGVILTGFVKGAKLQELLSNAALFILPSSHEGLPIALLEAMSYDLPALVSDIPANLEVGLPSDSYFEVGNVGQLREKIKHFIESPKASMQYDMSKYDWQTIADQVAEVYISLMK